MSPAIVQTPQILGCSLPGVVEKLRRSYENIHNLNAEIEEFVRCGKYPKLSFTDRQVMLEASTYHESRAVPLRFSVLAGEIIHNLRSCLDHIVWHFSEPAYRERNVRVIGFPVTKTRPQPNDSCAIVYERKVKGIHNRPVRSLIDRVQPFNGDNPSDSLLLAVHRLDLADKHRELVIVESMPAFEFPSNFVDQIACHGGGTRDSELIDLRDVQVVPQVAFKDFCGGEPEGVVRGLTFLHDYIGRLAAQFAELC